VCVLGALVCYRSWSFLVVFSMVKLVLLSVVSVVLCSVV
jgi:hypothetical protein